MQHYYETLEDIDDIPQQSGAQAIAGRPALRPGTGGPGAVSSEPLSVRQRTLIIAMLASSLWLLAIGLIVAVWP